MRTLLYIVLGLVVLLVGAVVALPYVVPQDYLRTTIAQQIERATGRDIALEGDVGLAVLPRPAASLGGLTIAGAAEVEGPPLLTLGSVDAELALVPLVSGQIQIDRFVVRGLEVELIVDEEGRTNWRATGATGSAPETGQGGGTPGETGGAETGGADGAPASLPAVSLGDVRLVDGAVRFTDRGAGIERAFESINGTVRMAALDQPLAVDVGGVLDGRDVTVEGRLGALTPILQGGATTLAATLASDGLDLGFDGDVAAGAPELTGTLDLALREASSTLSWLAGSDVSLPVETASLDGALTASPTRVVFDGATLAVDNVTGSGEMALALDAPRPALSGRLDLSEVDLAEFGMTAPTADTDDAGGASPTDDAAAEADAGGDGTAASGGWSRQPIAYAQPPIDLDLTLSVEGLRAPPIRFGAGELTLVSDAQRLLLTLERLAFYEGNAEGSVRLSPAADGLAIEKDVALSDIRTGPLLADLAGTGFLAGRADVRMALQTQGASQHDLVAAANGDGQVALGRAVLEGLQGKPELEALRALLALGGEPGAPLRIAGAEATFDLEDGVATNRDLTATTANLRLTGEGQLDFVNLAVPGYTLTPEATGALARVSPLQSVLVPLVLSGPFDDLRVRPDPSAVGTGAVEEVERALETAGEKARQGDLEGAAESIINEGLGGALEKFGIRP